MPVKLEDQVCSLESAKRLKELGCLQESLFYWSDKIYHRPSEKSSHIILHSYLGHYKHNECRNCYSAYTVAELGELLPERLTKKHGKIRIDKNQDETWEIRYSILNTSTGLIKHDDATLVFIEKTEAEARAKMLIYLLENNIIESKGRNGEK